MIEVKPLWAHQVIAIARALDPRTEELAFLHEQGTGKTRTIIETLRHQFARNGRILNTLIVCPLIVKRQWQEQFAQYSKIQKIDIVVLDGSEKKRCKTLGDMVNVDGQPMRNKIVIVNFAALEMKELLKIITLWGVEVLIVDEAHELKNPRSVRAKALLPLADGARYRYIATGTPIANTESDIFMQYRILDKGKTFGTNYWVFRKRYYRDDNAAWAGKRNHFPKYVCPPVAQEEIKKLIETKSVRALKKDCLDLPPYVRQTLEVEMSQDQQRAYKQMKEEYVTWIKDQRDQPRAVVAQLAITKAMKLQQIVSGFAFDEHGNAQRFKNVPRLEVLKEQLQNLTPNHKVIVWANFIENYKMIEEACDALGVKHAKIVGGMSEFEKNENRTSFNTDPDIRVLIGNQGAGGTGVDLIPASYAIYYSKDHSMLKDQQSEARNYRGGSHIHEKVTRIDLVCYGTIDEMINEALASKKNLADYILDREIL